jgi:hypothetical protein
MARGILLSESAARIPRRAGHHHRMKENPDVDLVDTQPNLDGYDEKFIDLMHLTQAGRK